MENLNTILEKILTLNVNANTNIDLQDIIIKYVLFTTIGKVLIAFFVTFTMLMIVKMIINSVNKATQAQYLLKTGKELKKFVDFNEKIDEILMYMPRNKTKRKGGE